MLYRILSGFKSFYNDLVDTLFDLLPEISPIENKNLIGKKIYISYWLKFLSAFKYV
jgi:hypothetical protein